MSMHQWMSSWFLRERIKLIVSKRRCVRAHYSLSLSTLSFMLLVCHCTMHTLYLHYVEFDSEKGGRHLRWETAEKRPNPTMSHSIPLFHIDSLLSNEKCIIIKKHMYVCTTWKCSIETEKVGLLISIPLHQLCKKSYFFSLHYFHFLMWLHFIYLFIQFFSIAHPITLHNISVPYKNRIHWNQFTLLWNSK